jgi:predicted PurR-regulated permease PerM
LVNVVGAALGLLVLPTWLLVVLKDQREGTQTLNRLLPAAVKADFWAVIRIVDRAFRAFLHGQVSQGFVAGLLTYLVVIALNGGGYLQVEYPLVVTLFVGSMELVPEIGPVIAVVVLGISSLLQSPVNALLAIALYLLVHTLAAGYVGSRTRRRIKELHPALLIVGAVALSEMGLLWVLLSVPLLTAARDLLGYAYARLSNPPRPAGLIPGEEPPPEEVVEVVQRVPSVYRRAATQRER